MHIINKKKVLNKLHVNNVNVNKYKYIRKSIKDFFGIVYYNNSKEKYFLGHKYAF